MGWVGGFEGNDEGGWCHLHAEDTRRETCSPDLSDKASTSTDSSRPQTGWGSSPEALTCDPDSPPAGGGSAWYTFDPSTGRLEYVGPVLSAMPIAAGKDTGRAPIAPAGAGEYQVQPNHAYDVTPDARPTSGAESTVPPAGRLHDPTANEELRNGPERQRPSEIGTAATPPRDAAPRAAPSGTALDTPSGGKDEAGRTFDIPDSYAEWLREKAAKRIEKELNSKSLRKKIYRDRLSNLPRPPAAPRTPAHLQKERSRLASTQRRVNRQPRRKQKAAKRKPAGWQRRDASRLRNAERKAAKQVKRLKRALDIVTKIDEATDVIDFGRGMKSLLKGEYTEAIHHLREVVTPISVLLDTVDLLGFDRVTGQDVEHYLGEGNAGRDLAVLIEDFDAREIANGAWVTLSELFQSNE
jgi:hypothetical protein